MTESAYEPTKEEIQSCISGKRPDNMPMDIFRIIRKNLNKNINRYLKGKFIKSEAWQKK